MNILAQSCQIMRDQSAEDNDQPSYFGQSQQVVDVNWSATMNLGLYEAGLPPVSTTDKNGRFV
jgi:hypothetical protein